MTFTLPERLEHLRLHHRLVVAGRASRGRHQRSFGSSIVPFAQSFQVGKVLEVAQRHSHHHGKHCWGTL
jgi:hypothetical protein